MRFIISFFFVIASLSVLAQGTYVPVQSTIRTPYGNVKTTTYQYIPGQMYYGGESTSSLKYQFTIVLANDSSLTTRAKIDFSEKQHEIKVKEEEGKKTLYPSHTKEIYRITTAGKKIPGVPADSCWLFKVFKGKINVYSFIPEESYDSVIAVQDGDNNPIVALTRANLEAIVGNQADPKVLKLIENNKLIKAVQQYNKRN